ncbi:hypothetical protein ACLKA6_008391 [Drosophila palustris]
MNCYKQLEFISLLWIVLPIYPVDGNNISSLMGIGSELTNHYLEKPTNGQSLVDDYIHIEIQVSRLFLSNWEYPIEELYNRSETKNISKTIMERFPLLKYYLTGVQIFFLRLFTGEFQVEVTAPKDKDYKDQVRALQDQHEKYNQTLRRWRQLMAQLIKYKFNTSAKIMPEKSSPKPKIPSYPTSVRPKYYDIMTKKSNGNSKENYDMEHRSGSDNSIFSIYQKAFILSLLDEPRVIRFYIQEIFRLSNILMNHTHYVML